jgi:hypothetical protein
VCPSTIAAIEQRVDESDGVDIIVNTWIRSLEDRTRLSTARLRAVYSRLHSRGLGCYPTTPGKPNEGWSFLVYRRSLLLVDLNTIFADAELNDALNKAQELLQKPRFHQWQSDSYQLYEALRALAPARREELDNVRHLRAV